jgi:hypothetical protein
MTADERATLAEECPDCGGNGLKSGGPSRANPCARCDGSGLLAEPQVNPSEAKEPDDEYQQGPIESMDPPIWRGSGGLHHVRGPGLLAEGEEGREPCKRFELTDDEPEGSGPFGF